MRLLIAHASSCVNPEILVEVFYDLLRVHMTMNGIQTFYINRIACMALLGHTSDCLQHLGIPLLCSIKRCTSANSHSITSEQQRLLPSQMYTSGYSVSTSIGYAQDIVKSSKNTK